MPSLPLVTSGAGTLIAYIGLMVALAVLVGALIGYLTTRSSPVAPEQSDRVIDPREHLRKAA